MTRARTLALSAPLLVLVAPATARATYSVVAADSAAGQVGGAVTSCVGSQGVGVVYRPAVGHGGVNAQASANSNGRDRACAYVVDRPRAIRILPERTSSTIWYWRSKLRKTSIFSAAPTMRTISESTP